jgi:hypothetical protein
MNGGIRHLSVSQLVGDPGPSARQGLLVTARVTAKAIEYIRRREYPHMCRSTNRTGEGFPPLPIGTQSADDCGNDRGRSWNERARRVEVEGYSISRGRKSNDILEVAFLILGNERVRDRLRFQFGKVRIGRQART